MLYDTLLLCLRLGLHAFMLLLCKFWSLRISDKKGWLEPQINVLCLVWHTMLGRAQNCYIGSRSDYLCINISVLRTLPCLYLQAETLTSDSSLSCKWHRLARVAGDLRKTKQLPSEETVNGNRWIFQASLTQVTSGASNVKSQARDDRSPTSIIHGDKESTKYHENKGPFWWGCSGAFWAYWGNRAGAE